MKVEMNMQGSLVATPNGVLDGIPTWTPDVEGVVELVTDPNGLSVSVKTLPPPTGDAVHTVTITFEADSDLGDGVKPLIGTFELTVFDPSKGATIVDISAGAFTKIPE